MQRLSKEQAEWLTQQFEVAHTNLMNKPAQGMFHILDCRSIINHCTEKDYDFEMNMDDHADDAFSVKVDQGDFSVCFTVFQDKLSDGIYDHEISTWLSSREFLEFYNKLTPIADAMKEAE